MQTWSSLPFRAKFYVSSLVFLAIPIFFHALQSVLTQQFRPYWYYWLILTAITLITVPIFVLLPSIRSLVTIGDAFIISICMLYGIHPAILANSFYMTLLTLILRRKHGTPTYRIIFNISIAVINVALYGWVFTNLGYLSASYFIADVLLPTLGLAITYFLSNSIFVAAAISLSSQINFVKVWFSNYARLSFDFILSASAGAFIYLFRDVNAAIPLLVAPFVGAIWGINKVNRAKVIEAERHLKEQEQLYLRTVESLAMAVDAKDQTTYGHIRRVKAYAMGLAQLCGLSNRQELMAIETGALLHDIGKLAIDDYILNKPGKLNRQEFEKMKLHSAAGDEILRQIQFPFPVAEVVRFHHERWDGMGYPDGLKAEEIPLGARILAIVDAYDAIRSSRPYKCAFGKEDAIALIRSQAGTVYDPHLANLFVEHIDDLEAAAQKAVQDISKISFRKFFETVDSALSSSNRALPTSGLPTSATAELVLLFEFCNGPAMHLELHEILSVLAGRIYRLVPFTTCAFFINKGNDRIKPAHVMGRFAEILKDMEIENGKGISGWVMTYKRPMLNASPALEFSGLHGQLSVLTDSLVVPMIIEADCVGTISLYAQPPTKYGQADLALLQAIAALVAPTIGQARRFKHSECELIDPVTRTYRIGYLSVVGTQMLEQAKQANSALSILLLEMRGLSRIIALCGLSAGDSLLHRVAEVLRAELRETDVLVRFGHEGFVALLPGVRGDQVARFSNRLHQHITSSTLGSFRGHPGLLDFQIGAACFPQDGMSVYALLQSAQRSMDNRRQSSLEDGDLDANVLEFPPRY